MFGCQSLREVSCILTGTLRTKILCQSLSSFLWNLLVKHYCMQYSNLCFRGTGWCMCCRAMREKGQKPLSCGKDCGGRTLWPKGNNPKSPRRKKTYWLQERWWGTDSQERNRPRALSATYLCGWDWRRAVRAMPSMGSREDAAAVIIDAHTVHVSQEGRELTPCPFFSLFRFFCKHSLP